MWRAQKQSGALGRDTSGFVIESHANQSRVAQLVKTNAPRWSWSCHHRPRLWCEWRFARRVSPEISSPRWGCWSSDFPLPQPTSPAKRNPNTAPEKQRPNTKGFPMGCKQEIQYNNYHASPAHILRFMTLCAMLSQCYFAPVLTLWVDFSLSILRSSTKAPEGP